MLTTAPSSLPATSELSSDDYALQQQRRSVSCRNDISSSSDNGGDEKVEDLSFRLREEALRVQNEEPQLSILLRRTVLAPGVVSFEDAVAATVCYRLLLQPCEKNKQNHASSDDSKTNGLQQEEPTAMFCPQTLRGLIRECMSRDDELELGHTMKEAIRQDALAVCRRDPATDTILEVVLFSKGYAALVCHRAAYRLWKFQKRKFTSLFLQSQASAVFGLDLHPLSQIGCKVMFDHGTGVVVGETATIGDGCTLLHGVTLGGTGKDHGDRHPKVGKNVLIGAGSSLLGNIQIGDGSKIGAGSVVLRAIPPGATAVGAPAKIVGRARESRPGSEMDETLENVSLLHKSESSSTFTGSTATTSATTPPPSLGELSESEEGDSSSGENDGRVVGEVRDTVSVCPYREYQVMAKNAPPRSVTICTLNSLLRPHGCKTCEIGACMFALDTHNVGYIRMGVFRAKYLEVIPSCTRLSRDEVETIMTPFLATRRRSTSVSNVVTA